MRIAVFLETHGNGNAIRETIVDAALDSMIPIDDFRFLLEYLIVLLYF